MNPDCKDIPIWKSHTTAERGDTVPLERAIFSSG